jgi:predicted RNase H-like nuclease
MDTFLDEYEELESMDTDELLAFAAETFKARLNKYKDKDGLIDDIMDLFVIEAQKKEIEEANLKHEEAEHLAKNGRVKFV